MPTAVKYLKKAFLLVEGSVSQKKKKKKKRIIEAEKTLNRFSETHVISN